MIQVKIILWLHMVVISYRCLDGIYQLWVWESNAERVSEIHMWFMKSLDCLFTDGFVSEFNLLKTGMTVSPVPTPWVHWLWLTKCGNGEH